MAAKKGRIEPSLLEETKEVLLEKLHLTSGGYLTMPEFTINPGDIMVKFTAPEDRVVNGPGKVSAKVTNGVTVRVTDAEKKILIQLEVDPGYSYVELAEKLGVSKKTIAEHIKSLKEKGIIRRIGNNKKEYWKIKD